MKLKFIGPKNYKLEANEGLNVVVKTFLCTFFSIIFISGFEVNAKTDIGLDKGANPFVPKEVLSNYFKSSQKQKMSYCSSSRSNAQDQVIRLSKTAPKRLKGFNSRMDNRDRVEGAKVLDEFSLQMSELMTSSWATKNNNQKEIALEALWNWAKSDALLATYNCKDGGDPECQKYWERSDGQDLSPSNDHSKSQMEVMHMAYAYFLTLSSFKPNDNRHAEIQNWFRKFSKRNRPPAKGDDLGFGLDFGWNWPAIFFGHLNSGSQYSGHQPKKILISLVKKIDELILEDGSIQNRTTRGNRALWYHLSALVETMITLEMARSFDVPIPKSLDRRLELSFELFVRGFENHSYMDQWAKVAYNSVYEAGVQVFRNTLDIPNGNSAFYIFMYRNPDSPITQILKKHLFPYKARARMDGYIGIGLGCIYGVAQEVAFGHSSISAKGNTHFWLPGLNTTILKGGDEEKVTFDKATVSKIEKEQNYEAIWFKLLNLDNGGLLSDEVNYKIMFNYKTKSDQKNKTPSVIRLTIKPSEFPSSLNYLDFQNCAPTTVKVRDDKIKSIRLAFGSDAEDTNCALENMDEKNQIFFTSVIRSLPDVIAFTSNDKRSEAAANILFDSLGVSFLDKAAIAAFLEKKNENLSGVPEVALKRRNKIFPGISDNYLKYFSPDFFQFKKATSVPHKYENTSLYEAIWFDVNNVQFENYKKHLVGFKLMLDFESLDKQRNRDVKHIRLSIGDWVFPDALDYVSLTKCHDFTIDTKNEKVVSLRVALGNDSERSNCTLKALTKKNRALLLGLASNLQEILEVAINAKDIAGIDRNDQKAAEAATIISSRFGALESSPKRVNLKVREEKYDRTKSGMKVRFKCLTDFASANNITELPANQEIESLTANLEGNDYYRSHRQIVKAGISKEAMDANKKALVRLVNFEGTNEEYCAKPVL